MEPSIVEKVTWQLDSQQELQVYVWLKICIKKKLKICELNLKNAGRYFF